ncbi:MAG: aldolase/citrate lyase family protein [Kiritimatiellales bacterium]
MSFGDFGNFKKTLKEKPLLGFGSMYSSPGIIERIGQHWDWCWIDMQHGEWGMHDTIQAIRACNLIGIYALVRVPGHSRDAIGKILDAGCHAIMIPMIESREEAEAVVAAARFAPMGQRSYGGRRPIDLYGRAYACSGRTQPMVVCQIETPAGFEQVDAIASTDGVDALFFGPDDMALSRNMPMDQPRSENHFDCEIAAVGAAAQKYGKIAGGIFVTPERIKKGIELGYHMLVSSGDSALLAGNSLSVSQTCRKALTDGSFAGSAKAETKVCSVY